MPAVGSSSSSSRGSCASAIAIFRRPLIAMREFADQPIGLGSEPYHRQHFGCDVVGELRSGSARHHMQRLSRRHLGRREAGFRGRSVRERSP